MHTASSRQLDELPRFDVPSSALQVPAEPCETTSQIPASLSASSWKVPFPAFPTDRKLFHCELHSGSILGTNPGATPAQKPALSPLVLNLSPVSATLGRCRHLCCRCTGLNRCSNPEKQASRFKASLDRQSPKPLYKSHCFPDSFMTRCYTVQQAPAHPDDVQRRPQARRASTSRHVGL